MGFFIFTALLGIGDNDMFDLGGLIGAIIGTMILLGIYRAVAGRRRRAPQDRHDAVAKRVRSRRATH